MKINEHRRLKGVYSDGRRYYTKALGKISVYGERTVKDRGDVYRQWNPRRSKLGAALSNGISQWGIKPGSNVLYLGAASGTTVSHVADMVGKEGLVYALDLSKTTTRKLMRVVDAWPNVAPLLFSASRPDSYRDLVGDVDIVFQDIAQREQARIFIDNCMLYLPPGGFGILSVKAKSIDITRKPKQIFNTVLQQLEREMTIVDQRTLEPHQEGHHLFVVKRR